MGNQLTGSFGFANTFAKGFYLALLFVAGCNWTTRLGGISADGFDTVALDNANNSYAGGYFESTLSAGGTTLVTPGRDWLVSKFGPNGEVLWAQAFGGTAPHILRSIAVDRAHDEVVAAGNFVGKMTFGGVTYTANGNNDNAIVKLKSDGSLVWSRAFNGAGEADVAAIGIDGQGNIYLTGYYNGSFAFGNDVLSSPNGTGDREIFLAKMDRDGNPLWAKHFPNLGVGFSTAIAVSSAGDVAMTGIFYFTIDFGTGPLAIPFSPEGFPGAGAAFVARFDSDGVCQWSKMINTPSVFSGYMRGTAIAFDSLGNVVAAGDMRPDSNLIQNVAWIGKYSGSDGSFQWPLRQTYSGSNPYVTYGGTGSNSVGGVGLDSQDNIIMTGTFGYQADFGTGTISTPNSGTGPFEQNLFVARYSSDGRPTGAAGYGGAGQERASAIAVNPSGFAVVAGAMSGTGSFAGPNGPITLTSAGFGDALVMSP